jgi:predicted permease
MFKNYFAIALRNFWRHKIFSLITLSGLAIGISTSLVIYLIVQYNFSIDTFHAGSERMYRVVSNHRVSGEEHYNSGVPSPLYKAVQQEVTGVEGATGFLTYGGNVQIPAATNREPILFKNEFKMIFADEGYFRFFPRRWLAGSQKAALSQPFTVVISEAKAKKYFPKVSYADVIGRRIVYNESIQTTVTGVVADAPANTDFAFEEFLSLATVHATDLLKSDYGLEGWGSTSSASQLFVKLTPQTTPAQVHEQLKKLMKKYSPKNNQDVNITAEWALQPLRNMHFNGNYNSYFIPIASRTTLYGLMAVALFLLLLGCINFINLTTAQSTQRAKEIGIRKTIGSSKKQLILQFLGETFFITLLATIFSVVLTPWILKVFADFVPAGLSFNLQEQPHIIVFLLLLTVVVTLLSGFYPAYVLSAYKPVLVLKNQGYANTGNTRSAWLRKTLTVSQFVIAQVFIMATVLVSKQIHYSLTKELGFKKEAIFSFDIPFNLQLFRQKQPETKHTVLVKQLQALPEIAQLSVSGAPPSSNAVSTGPLKYVDGKKELETDVQFKYGDTSYIKLYGLHLLAGRNIRPSDSTVEYVINETYAKMLGFKKPEDAIGKNLQGNNKNIPIVGVIGDFHQRSLHEPIKPLALTCAIANHYTFHVALRPQVPGSNAWKTAIAKIEKAYKQLYPKDDFQYSFYDDSIASFYKADQDTSRLLSWATGLSILISCLGLLGLAIYTTNQRRKEIGIRKVLGATVAQILTTLSKDFMQLVIIAFVIAVPIAWWGMEQWLQNFAYRTTITWWVFGASGTGMLLLAVLVLMARTVKAAIANPVKSLRTE